MNRLAVAHRGADRDSAGGWRAVSARHVVLSLLLLFAALVGAGITGSSVQMYLDQPGFVESDGQVLFGENRLIRADEWLVVTRMAIGQQNHRPARPILNSNLGPDGQNMLVVGMTGVPVAHVSALAKPATWGFFAFDLRRALAWYWWLPPFGCLLALWGVMAVLVPGRWKLGLATAAVFTSSGYVIAWSNWPAYAVLFPAAAFWLFFQLPKALGVWRLMAWAIGFGLSLAGFVLVLYPPWQITLGYLFGLLTIAVVVRDRCWTQMTLPRTAALVGSIAVFALICGSWWLDAKPAIDAMQATLYPGQRTTIAGGGMYLLMSFRGFLNAHTLYFNDGALNASESSSFLYFYPVAAAALLIPVAKGRIRPDAVEAALLLFCVVALWFQLIGFGPWLAEQSLWGRVVPARVDLSLGLASVLWCSLRLGKTDKGSVTRTPAWIIMAIALAWAAVVTVMSMSSPQVAVGPLPAWLWAALPIGVFALSWALLARHAKAFLGALLAINVLTAFAFNPIVRAPTFVRATPALLEQTGPERKATLVVGNLTGATALLAAGLPITNGVFYYPPLSLWNALDPDHAFESVWNRYQHLVFEPMTAGSIEPGDRFRVEKKRDDAVRVAFDPQRFDFQVPKAELVLAPADLDLSRNPYLNLIMRQGSQALYQIRPAPKPD
ncbi:MAG: hypothetical protein ABJB17_12715 [Burkholderiales bacterium]